ncbi:MAG: hypothetical protein U0V70_16335 [Terriglobia bacterium]
MSWSPSSERTFRRSTRNSFQDFSIDTKGLQQVEGKTFRWKGEYGFSLNEAKTLDTQLNVFESFSPEIPKEYRDCQHAFLGNIDPIRNAKF